MISLVSTHCDHNKSDVFSSHNMEMWDCYSAIGCTTEEERWLGSDAYSLRFYSKVFDIYLSICIVFNKVHFNEVSH